MPKTVKKQIEKIEHNLKDEQQSLETFYDFTLDDEQKILRDAIWNPEKKVIIADAKAGTGKTFVSVATANLLVKYKYYKKIIYICAPCQEEKQGYLPGSQEDKSAPYMAPLYEALLKIGLNPAYVVDSDENYEAKKNGTAYVIGETHTFLRGTTIEDSILICDESQNYYLDELKKVITRACDTSKVILIGHRGQCDLYKHAEKSGFVPYLEYYKSLNDDRVAICQLTHNHRGWISTSADNIDEFLAAQKALDEEQKVKISSKRYVS